MQIRKSPKRLVIDIHEEDHFVIKEMALKKKITLEQWVLDALTKAAAGQAEESQNRIRALLQEAR